MKRIHIALEMKNLSLRLSVFLALIAFAVPVFSQDAATRKGLQNNQQKTQPSASKQTDIAPAPAGQADYNLGLIVKKIAALETQVAALQHQNQTLAGQLSSLQKQNEALSSQSKNLAAQLKSQASGMIGTGQKLQGLESRINQVDSSLSVLNSSYQSHKHYMPPIGEQALSAIAGMQEIANKSGVGYVKPQWENIRVLFRTQKSFGIDFTGPIYVGQ